MLPIIIVNTAAAAAAAAAAAKSLQSCLTLCVPRGEKMNGEYGEGTVNVIIKDSYYNMREKLEENLFIVDRAKAAMTSLGIEPIVVPIRGGTDGARLSFMGLPCPNLKRREAHRGAPLFFLYR